MVIDINIVDLRLLNHYLSLDKPDTHNFDFLSEISKGYTYHLLFPDPKAGLAIVWLYQRIESGVFVDKTFTETDIHDAFPEHQCESSRVITPHAADVPDDLRLQTLETAGRASYLQKRVRFP